MSNADRKNPTRDTIVSTQRNDAREVIMTPIRDALTQLVRTLSPLKLADVVRNMGDALLWGMPSATEVDLLAMLAEWADKDVSPDVLAGTPAPPVGRLTNALVAWRPDGQQWELRAVGWCRNAGKEGVALRRQATWTVGWGELPDHIRESVVRSGKKTGSLEVVREPDRKSS